jgi:hypothetical protein
MEDGIAALVNMGFSAIQAKHALLLEQNNIERAADMLLTNPPLIEDEDVEMILDDPPSSQNRPVNSVKPYRSHPYGSDSALAFLVDMGFDTITARQCLDENGGDVQAAAERLLATSTSNGPSQSSRQTANNAMESPSNDGGEVSVIKASHMDNSPIASSSPLVSRKRGRKTSSSAVNEPGPDNQTTSADLPPDQARASIFTIGCAAKMVGLTSAAGKHLNGKLCKLLEQDLVTKRWTVEFTDGSKKTKALKEDNLQYSEGSTESNHHTVSFQASYITFGPAAFQPLRARPTITDVARSANLNVKKIVEASVLGVKEMRGERGMKFVTKMLSDCYQQGLFMHGPPSSPVNSEIIPAMHFIFDELNKAPAKDAKRVSYLTDLANACQDCQQVQARVILRVFGDLTSQSDTFEGQLRYTLLRQKEAALDRYISRKHADCDKDHEEVDPWKQRVHLTSGYLAVIGEEFGFDGVAAALSDRFLPQVKAEIGRINAKSVMEALKKDMSPKEWLQTLLADINNQTPGSVRFINRDCIFKWAQSNLSDEVAHLIFYDEDRSAEFEDLDPKEPTPENRYQPFLGPKLLVDMLLKAGMLTRKN